MGKFEESLGAAPRREPDRPTEARIREKIHSVNLSVTTQRLYHGLGRIPQGVVVVDNSTGGGVKIGAKTANYVELTGTTNDTRAKVRVF